jgi:8-amino-7-oxononanoate synthase
MLDRLVDRRSQTIPKLVQRLRQRDGLVQQPVAAVAGPRVRVHGRWLLNFASTNYLGLSQDPRVLRAISRAVPTWGTSLGMPRLFATDRLTARLETEIANLVGQEGALVFPSTTHLALDLLPLLAGPNGALFVDEWAYPISLQGAHVAAQRGARIHRFPHNDYQALARALQARASIPDKVIVCDGVYPARGQPASLREIAGIARTFDAVVYVDDAHGIGVLGSSPTREMPYGRGGGGTLRHLNVAPGNIVHVGSLSKAFGVPVAFVAGPAGFINYLRATAATYIHSSPPAIPVLAAALGALRIHAICGETLRHRLANRVRRFRGGLASASLRLPANRLFPIQTLRFMTPRHAEAAARELRRMGVWAVLQLRPPDHPKGGVLRFVFSARHQEADIDEAIVAISHTLRFVLDPSVVVVRQ